jgi:ribosomal protein S12 methylthiotransferase
MKDQVEEALKQKRYNKLMTLQQEISRENLSKLVGKTYNAMVLSKNEASCSWEGRLSIQAPEVDGFVYITGEGLDDGHIIPFRITG